MCPILCLPVPGRELASVPGPTMFKAFSTDDLIFHVGVKTSRDLALFDDHVIVNDFTDRLAKVEDHGGSILAFALMTSHAHLLIRAPSESALANMMRDVLGPVARFRNVLHHQQGPLFVRPFWRRHVDSRAYLLHLAFYIHANPAPRFRDLSELDLGWQTSHAAWSGARPSWLRPDDLITEFGGFQRYLAYCASWLGRRRVVSRRLLAEPAAETAIIQVARWFRMHPATLLDESRGGTRDRRLLAWWLRSSSGLWASEIGDLLKIDLRMLHRWVTSAQADDLLHDARDWLHGGLKRAA